MNPRLLQEFLVEDSDPKSRAELFSAIKSMVPGTEHVRNFSFNRFNVRLDARNQEVVIEDVLDVGKSGEYQIDFKSFVEALQRFA